MATSDGWYLIGPLVAVVVVGFLGTVFWRMGLQWTGDEDPERPRGRRGGRAILDTGDDYGLLGPAAIADDPELADDIRGLLADAGIRATYAHRRDGRVLILVFAEELEEARRLVGGSPAL
ncbi:hypothetical protein EV385_1680 [Krasilnikovia cinnamomea]|uniref:Uncharacterized protein n=1 Tax=Krasilnikovia cinnamomea TaxID=349313 RepID=A0A4Q7ZI63_9ACTN|nr:hypothetical protein [Krasilnikovia cinnamomea]RZU49923.1 hypothetical protein EV385_1680 [Krasilnikovia cinnamomea]